MRRHLAFLTHDSPLRRLVLVTPLLNHPCAGIDDYRAAPRLLPRSPVRVFTLPDAHEIFVVNESFELDERRRHGQKRRARITKIE